MKPELYEVHPRGMLTVTNNRQAWVKRKKPWSKHVRKVEVYWYCSVAYYFGHEHRCEEGHPPSHHTDCHWAVKA